MQQGKFIVLEGLEGAGKSSAISWIEALLKAHHKTVIKTREPGGTPIAEEIRSILKRHDKEDCLTDKTELLLFYAARIQLVETVIAPALKRGDWVIGDRHDLSTQAYQGAGRKMNSEFLTLLKQNVLQGFKPDLTLYLDLDPKIGLQRAQKRGELDRFEQEELTFFERVRAQFLTLAKQDESIIVINAEQSMEQVKLQIESVLNEQFFNK